MYAGQYVFMQLMDHLPWHVFRRCVGRYGGDRKVKSFSCLDQFRYAAAILEREADVAGKPARHRSVFAGTVRKALSSGLPLRANLAQHHGERQCGTGLAYLRGFRAVPDPDGAERSRGGKGEAARGALGGEFLGRHHRFVLHRLRLDAQPGEQGE